MGKKSAKSAKLFVSADDFEEGEISAPEKDDIVHHTKPHANVQNQTTVNSLNLSLHNNFEVLESGSEHVLGDAKLSDEDSIPILMDMYNDKNPIVEESPRGKEDFNHSTTLETSGKLVKKTSTAGALSSSNPLLGPVNGRQSFPITGPSSLVQSSSIGRHSIPNTTVGSLGEAGNPSLDDTIHLQPIIIPITTTDEVLGQDKRKVLLTSGPSNISAACLKDGKTLSKYWGDVDTDSTFDHETDSEAHKTSTQFPDASQYLETPFDKVQKSKRDRPKKQKSPNTTGDPGQHKKSFKHDKEYVNTRSQAGS